MRADQDADGLFIDDLSAVPFNDEEVGFERPELEEPALLWDARAARAVAPQPVDQALLTLLQPILEPDTKQQPDHRSDQQTGQSRGQLVEHGLDSSGERWFRLSTEPRPSHPGQGA
jgi:hypothetical protein